MFVFLCVCVSVGRRNTDIQRCFSAVVLYSNTGIAGEGQNVCVVSLHKSVYMCLCISVCFAISQTVCHTPT